jgi:hypothetical protein
VQSSRIIVGSFLSFSFSLLRGSAIDCRSCVDWAIPPCFFWAALPLSSILELEWTLFGKRYMDIYNRKHKFVLFWEQARPLASKHSLRSCRWILEHHATSFPRPAQERVESCLANYIASEWNAGQTLRSPISDSS